MSSRLAKIFIIVSILMLIWCSYISYNNNVIIYPIKRYINLTHIPKSHIVKMIHQSWKTHDLPPSFKLWSQSWARCYPNWEYKLWSDEENRELIRKHYPWFLPVYDLFPRAILRADVMRAFYMHHSGGIYADLDAECLKPFEHLLENTTVVFGAMAGGSSLLGEGYTQNSFMYSKRGHKFWMAFIRDIVNKVNNTKSLWGVAPEAITGPFILMSSIRTYRQTNRNDITIYPPLYFNPFSWMQKAKHPACKDLNQMTKKEYKTCRGYFVNSSYVVQYHSQSWGAGDKRIKTALADYN